MLEEIAEVGRGKPIKVHITQLVKLLIAENRIFANLENLKFSGKNRKSENQNFVNLIFFYYKNQNPTWPIHYSGFVNNHGPHGDNCRIYFDNGDLWYEGSMENGFFNGNGNACK